MTKFCKTHAPDRTVGELEERKAALEARDLSALPGLQVELTRINDLLAERATGA